MTLSKQAAEKVTALVVEHAALIEQGRAPNLAQEIESIIESEDAPLVEAVKNHIKEYADDLGGVSPTFDALASLVEETT